MIYFADEPGDEAFAKCSGLMRWLRENPVDGLAEITPGFISLLLEFDAMQIQDLTATVERIVAGLRLVLPAKVAETPIVEVPVVYDGPDLQRVAEHNHLSREEVIALHSEPIYKVYLLGFAPGFPYLGDLNPRLHTPRLATPRTRVAPGSVAIGGEHTGIYSVETPGGWNLIGHTMLKLFNLSHDPQTRSEEMFLLQAGGRVKFVPTHG